MGIDNFPAALQPLIQQNFLERAFAEALRSQLGYRDVADRELFPQKIGETLTKTRRGQKAPATTPLVPSTNTNLDNGLTPTTWTVEQYTVTLNLYADTIDLNTVTNRVGIVEQFMQNAIVNGVQAAQTLDRLARNQLFTSYFSGNSRVRITLGSAGPIVAIDDIRGFQTAAINGVMAPISGTNTLTVTLGSNAYTLVAATPDATNVSTAPNGVSGTLTFSGNVTVADGTAGNTVQAANACVILRPNGRANSSLLVGTDVLAMAPLLDAVAALRSNNVPDIDGAYNCYLDPISGRQLFADPDFKLLFQGATSANDVFRKGMVNDFLGLRFMPTTEAFLQPHPSIAGLKIRRPIICGQGALIEGDFDGMGKSDGATPADSVIEIVDSIAMVTREPLDRLQQIIAQSWYWIGGFTAPTDVTTNSTIIPTASNAAFKRAVMIEHVG
jgi:N4-gp56 family major capsid protein